MPPRVGRPALAIGAIALAGLLAMPALAQERSPSPSDDPSASASPEASASVDVSPAPDSTASEPAATSLEPTATSAPSVVAPSVTAAPVASGGPSPAAASADEDENESSDADEADAPPIMLIGIVGVDTGEKHPHYTLTVGSVVYELEAGPWWFWGDDHPLAPFVGHAVAISGRAEGEHGVEVFSANGTTIREPGRPPWAGGPKVVGEKHPGWKPWMADGKPGKGPKAAESATP